MNCSDHYPDFEINECPEAPAFRGDILAIFVCHYEQLDQAEFACGNSKCTLMIDNDDLRNKIKSLKNGDVVKITLP